MEKMAEQLPGDHIKPNDMHETDPDNSRIEQIATNLYEKEEDLITNNMLEKWYEEEKGIRVDKRLDTNLKAEEIIEMAAIMEPTTKEKSVDPFEMVPHASDAKIGLEVSEADALLELTKIDQQISCLAPGTVSIGDSK